MLSRYPPKYTSRSLGLLWGNNYVGCSFGGYPTGNTGGGLLERPTGYKYNDNWNVLLIIIWRRGIVYAYKLNIA